MPLLRKTVEWAEAEAAKPAELCEWEQVVWKLTPDRRNRRPHLYNATIKLYRAIERAYNKAPECGTCYCVAGYIAAQTDRVPRYAEECEVIAAEELGVEWDEAARLFHWENTIEDVRRIAEDIAGERL